jgi:hypothetical protein
VIIGGLLLTLVVFAEDLLEVRLMARHRLRRALYAETHDDTGFSAERAPVLREGTMEGTADEGDKLGERFRLINDSAEAEAAADEAARVDRETREAAQEADRQRAANEANEAAADEAARVDRETREAAQEADRQRAANEANEAAADEAARVDKETREAAQEADRQRAATAPTATAEGRTNLTDFLGFSPFEHEIFAKSEFATTLVGRGTAVQNRAAKTGKSPRVV